MANIFQAAGRQGYLDQQQQQTENQQKQQELDLKNKNLQYDIQDREAQRYLDQFNNQLVGLKQLAAAATTPQQKQAVSQIADHMKDTFGGGQAQRLGVDNYIKQSIDIAIKSPDAVQASTIEGQAKDAGMTSLDKASLDEKKAATNKSNAEADQIRNPFGDTPPASTSSPLSSAGQMAQPSAAALNQPIPGLGGLTGGQTPPVDPTQNPGMTLNTTPNSIVPKAVKTDAWSVNPVDENYLKSLPPREQTIIKQLARGDMAYPSSFALSKPAWQKAMSDLPNYDPSANANRKANRAQWDTGKLGNTVRSLDVATSHLDTLGNLVDALGNGDINRLNQMKNGFAKEIGKPAPANLDAAKQIVSDEIVKAIVGAGGTGDDRRGVQDTVSKVSSPDQLKGVINTYQQLMAGQLHGLKKQYEDSTGHANFMTKLTPTTRATMAAVQFGVPAPALKALQHDPTLADQFDAKYGAGLSAEILGQ